MESKVFETARQNLKAMTDRFPPYLKDDRTGFEFDRSTRDAPIGSIWLRFSINETMLCCVEARRTKNKSPHQPDLYVIMREQLVSSLNAHSAAHPKLKLPELDSLIPLLLEGWHVALSGEVPSVPENLLVVLTQLPQAR